MALFWILIFNVVAASEMSEAFASLTSQIAISSHPIIYSCHCIKKERYACKWTLQHIIEKKPFFSLTGETAVAVRMAVVMRRKLQFYYWKNRQTNRNIKEIENTKNRHRKKRKYIRQIWKYKITKFKVLEIQASK